MIAGLQKLALRHCGVLLLLSERDRARETLAAEIPGRDFSALEGLMEIVEGKAPTMPSRRKTCREFRARLEGFVDARAPPAAEAPKRRERAA